MVSDYVKREVKAWLVVIGFFGGSALCFFLGFNFWFKGLFFWSLALFFVAINLIINFFWGKKIELWIMTKMHKFL